MLNKVILMGRICKDLELKLTTNDKQVCSFTIAVERKFQKQGEEKQTDFIPIIAWNKLAEVVTKYFSKGSMINIVGSLQVRSWDDSDQKKRYSTEVIADEVNFTGEKSEKQNNNKEDTSGFAPFEYKDPPF